MRTEAEQDELIRKALLDTLAFEWADTLAAAPAAPMSTRQAKRMNAMLRDPIGYARRYARSKWKRIAEKVAIFILIFTVSFGALYAVSPTVRATVSRWIEKFTENYIVYQFTGEKTEDTLPHYEITELPEGYSFYEEKELPDYRRIVYRSTEGVRLSLEYVSIRDGTAFLIKMDSAIVHDVLVNGNEGQVVLSNDKTQSSSIIWMDEYIGIQFHIDAFVDSNMLVSLAESVHLHSE